MWFSADFHLGHKNIISLCNRPFSNIEEMNDEIIFRWNSVVSKNDECWFLGDFSFHNWNVVQGYIERLNGRINSWRETMMLSGIRNCLLY